MYMAMDCPYMECPAPFSVVGRSDVMFLLLFSSMLKIKRFRDTDVGIYTCTASNVYGNLSYNFDIKIKGEKIFGAFLLLPRPQCFTCLANTVKTKEDMKRFMKRDDVMLIDDVMLRKRCFVERRRYDERRCFVERRRYYERRCDVERRRYDERRYYVDRRRYDEDDVLLRDDVIMRDRCDVERRRYDERRYYIDRRRYDERRYYVER